MFCKPSAVISLSWTHCCFYLPNAQIRTDVEQWFRIVNTPANILYLIFRYIDERKPWLSILFIFLFSFLQSPCFTLFFLTASGGCCSWQRVVSSTVFSFRHTCSYWQAWLQLTIWQQDWSHQRMRSIRSITWSWAFFPLVSPFSFLSILISLMKICNGWPVYFTGTIP